MPRARQGPDVSQKGREGKGRGAGEASRLACLASASASPCRRGWSWKTSLLQVHRLSRDETPRYRKLESYHLGAPRDPWRSAIRMGHCTLARQRRRRWVPPGCALAFGPARRLWSSRSARSSLSSYRYNTKPWFARTYARMHSTSRTGNEPSRVQTSAVPRAGSARLASDVVHARSTAWETWLPVSYFLQPCVERPLFRGRW